MSGQKISHLPGIQIPQSEFMKYGVFRNPSIAGKYALLVTACTVGVATFVVKDASIQKLLRSRLPSSTGLE